MGSYLTIMTVLMMTNMAADNMMVENLLLELGKCQLYWQDLCLKLDSQYDCCFALVSLFLSAAVICRVL